MSQYELIAHHAHVWATCTRQLRKKLVKDLKLRGFMHSGWTFAALVWISKNSNMAKHYSYCKGFIRIKCNIFLLHHSYEDYYFIQIWIFFWIFIYLNLFIYRLCDEWVWNFSIFLCIVYFIALLVINIIDKI